MPLEPPGSILSASPRLWLAGERRNDLEADLLHLEVVEVPGQAFCCRARFLNWGQAASRGPDFSYFGERRPELGAELVVKVQDDGSDVQIFRGHLNALAAGYPEGRPPEVEITAEDPLQRLRMFQRSRTFEGLSDAELIAGIAAEYGLDPEVELDGETHLVVVQLQQTDLDFVRERARSAGGEIWVRDGRLVAWRRGDSSDPEVALKLGSSLRSFEVRADLADQVTGLWVHGWDVAQKQEAVGSAGAGSATGGLGGYIDGGAEHQAAFGAREVQLARSGPPALPQAERLAGTYYEERVRRFVRGHGVGIGLPNVKVGGKVSMRGLGDLFDGGYDVVRVRHLFDTVEGYRTEMDVERQGMVLKPAPGREQPDDDDDDHRPGIRSAVGAVVRRLHRPGD